MNKNKKKTKQKEQMEEYNFSDEIDLDAEQAKREYFKISQKEAKRAKKDEKLRTKYFDPGEAMDEAQWWKIKTQHKRRKFVVLFGLIALVIIAFAIAGIVLASIDFAHHIYTTKSICFMAFGMLPFGLLIIFGLIDSIRNLVCFIKTRRMTKAMEVAAIVLEKHKRPTIEQIAAEAKAAGANKDLVIKFIAQEQQEAK